MEMIRVKNVECYRGSKLEDLPHSVEDLQRGSNYLGACSTDERIPYLAPDNTIIKTGAGLFRAVYKMERVEHVTKSGKVTKKNVQKIAYFNRIELA